MTIKSQTNKDYCLSVAKRIGRRLLSRSYDHRLWWTSLNVIICTIKVKFRYAKVPKTFKNSKNGMTSHLIKWINENDMMTTSQDKTDNSSRYVNQRSLIANDNINHKRKELWRIWDVNRFQVLALFKMLIAQSTLNPRWFNWLKCLLWV